MDIAPKNFVNNFGKLNANLGMVKEYMETDYRFSDEDVIKIVKWALLDYSTQVADDQAVIDLCRGLNALIKEG